MDRYTFPEYIVRPFTTAYGPVVTSVQAIMVSKGVPIKGKANILEFGNSGGLDAHPPCGIVAHMLRVTLEAAGQK